MKIRNISIACLVASLLCAGIVYDAEYHTGTWAPQSTSEAAAGIIFLSVPFLFGLPVVNLVLLVMSLVRLFAKPRFEGERTYAFINAVINLTALLIILIPSFFRLPANWN